MARTIRLLTVLVLGSLLLAGCGTNGSTDGGGSGDDQTMDDGGGYGGGY